MIHVLVSNDMLIVVDSWMRNFFHTVVPGSSRFELELWQVLRLGLVGA